MQREPMSFTPNPALVPDRDNLPFKKRDQRPNSPAQQQCDAATFKAPYPYKTKPTGPFQPVPRRVPALHQPWMQTHTSTTRSKPHIHSAFRQDNGWTEWREFNPVHLGWNLSHHYQHQGHLPGRPVFHPGHPHHPSRFTLVPEGFQRVGGGPGWEQLKTIRDKSLSIGRNKGPYVRRQKDKKVEYFPRVETASPPSLSTCLPHYPPQDPTLQHALSHRSTKIVKPPVSGHSFMSVSPRDHSGNTFISMKEEASRSSAPACSQQALSSSSSPNRFPWLLPHFGAGSLIELRDGQLRRVEHLQTEDFLLGSLACPDLCLSCCTVQNISPSTSSSAISRLLILLHNQQTQEMVDVYVEYPFFVRGQGWSSCSPRRTARLCGLQCRQLNVGDVCLALTPVSAPHQPPPQQPAPMEPKISPGQSEPGCESLKVLPAPQGPTGGHQKKTDKVRRRHCSAPELRGPGTNCM